MVEVIPISNENLHMFSDYMGVLKNNFSSTGIWLGAVINKFPCGVLIANEDTDEPDVCDVISLFVPEPLRREGIASCLMETLIEKCKQQGYKEILFNSVTDEKSLQEITAFLKKYDFSAPEIVANTYIFDDLESILNNKNVQRAISHTFMLPKGIDILPLDEVNEALLDEVKKEVNIKYPDYYSIFPTDISKNLKHINTFVAVADNSKIIGWLTGLDVYGLNIFYKTFYVDEKFRHLGIGYFLINYCIKNQALKYKKIPAMCGISLKNPDADKFNRTLFKGVKKSVSHEFISRKKI